MELDALLSRAPALTVADGWFVGDHPDPSARPTGSSMPLNRPGVTGPASRRQRGARGVHLLLGGTG